MVYQRIHAHNHHKKINKNKSQAEVSRLSHAKQRRSLTYQKLWSQDQSFDSIILYT